MFSALKDLARRIGNASIWAKDAIPPEEFKYRHIKRVWLVYFDLISVLIGVLAVAHGTRLLRELFPQATIDVFGTVFAVAAFVALLGVAFPRLWMPEIFGKVVMVGMLGAYSAVLWFSYFTGASETGFVAAMILLPLATPFLRLQMLGEEIKQRKAAGV